MWTIGENLHRDRAIAATRQPGQVGVLAECHPAASPGERPPRVVHAVASDLSDAATSGWTNGRRCPPGQRSAKYQKAEVNQIPTSTVKTRPPASDRIQPGSPRRVSTSIFTVNTPKNRQPRQECTSTRAL